MRLRLGLLGLLAAGGLQAQAPADYAPPATSYATEYTTAAPVEGRVWGSAEYVLGFMRRPSSPPLIRTGAGVDLLQTPIPDSAVLPTLYPRDGRRVDYNSFNGARLRAGAWLNPEQTVGVEATGLGFEQRTEQATFFSVAPNPNFLTRFYFDPNEDRNIFLFGDNRNGPVAARATAQIDPVWTADINAVVQGYAVLADRVDWLVGFRYYDQRESLQADLAQRFNNGNFFSLTDRFATTNQFYGINLGWRSKFYATNRWSADVTGKLAFGDSYQTASIRGNTVIDISGAPVETTPFGLLARPSNSGEFDRHYFAVLPELNLRLNYALTSRAKFTIGYDLLYISSVTRPGQAIDPVVNDADLTILDPAGRTVGPVVGRPAFTFRSTDMWIQAITFGLSVDF